MSLLMDALKKAETDKHKQDRVEDARVDSKVSGDNVSDNCDTLSLELTEHNHEFDDLPESDVVDEPVLQNSLPGEPPALELESVDSEASEPPRPVTLPSIRRSNNRRHFYLAASALGALSVFITAYYFWQMQQVQSTVYYPQQNLVIEQQPDKPGATPTGHPSTAADTTIKQVTASASAEPVNRRTRPALNQEPAQQQRSSDPANSKTAIRIRRKTGNTRNTQNLQRAYRAYQRGDMKTARQVYQLVLKRLPRNRDALLGLAAVALSDGKPAQARTYYQQLLELNPADPLVRRALIDLQDDASEQTTSQIKYWLQTDDDDPALQFVLGNRFASNAQWSKAQQAYFHAYTGQPDNADYAFNLAVSLDRLNQPQLAIRYYRIALKNAAMSRATFDRRSAQQRLQTLESGTSDTAS